MMQLCKALILIWLYIQLLGVNINGQLQANYFSILASSSQCPSAAGIAVNSATGIVYVSCYGNILVINGTQISRIRVPCGSTSLKLAIDYETGIVYAQCLLKAFSSTVSTLSVIISINGSIVSTIPNSDNCGNPYFDSSTGILYAQCSGSFLGLISFKGYTINTFTFPCTANGIRIVQLDSEAGITHIGCTSPNGIFSINGSTTTSLLTSDQCGQFPIAIYSNRKTGIIYVTCLNYIGDLSPEIISITGSNVATIMAGDKNSECQSMDGNSVTGIVYVTCHTKGVIFINGSTINTLLTSEQCPSAFRIAVDTTGIVYVTCYTGTIASVISITICPSGYYCPNTVLFDPPILCPPGSYCPITGLYSRISCPAGSYCPNSGSTSPGPHCAAGYFCPSGSSLMNICPAGSYCPNTISMPIICDSGSYCPINGSTSVGPKCPAGSYCLTGTILPTPCSISSYCPFNSLTITPCPIGSYCPFTGLFNYILCPAGFYCPTQSLALPIICLAGFYCPTTNLSSGSVCPLGSFCPIGSISPISCPEGYYCPYNTINPNPCPLDYSCPIGSGTPLTSGSISTTIANSGSNNVVQNSIIGGTVSGVIGLIFLILKVVFKRRAAKHLQEILDGGKTSFETDQAYFNKGTIQPITKIIMKNFQTSSFMGYESAKNYRELFDSILVLISNLRSHKVDLDLPSMSPEYRELNLLEIVKIMRRILVPEKKFLSCDYCKKYFTPELTPTMIEMNSIEISAAMALWQCTWHKRITKDVTESKMELTDRSSILLSNSGVSNQEFVLMKKQIGIMQLQIEHLMAKQNEYTTDFEDFHPSFEDFNTTS